MHGLRPTWRMRGLSVLLKGTEVIKQDCDLNISPPHVGFWASILCVSSPEPQPQGYCRHIQNKQTDKIDKISAGRQQSFIEQNPAHFHSNKIRSSPTDVLREPNALERATLPFKVCVCACVFEWVRACIQGRKRLERHGRGSQPVTDISQDLQLALSFAISAEQCVYLVQAQNTKYDKFVTQVWLFCKADEERERERKGEGRGLISPYGESWSQFLAET